jgi:hypothetical protein
MPLASPTIVEPISVWTKTLLVTGAMSGATIMIRSIGPNPRDIATQSGGSGWDWLKLLPGISLEASDLLQAMQILGGDKSPWTPDSAAYPVNKTPTNVAELSAVTMQTFPWECGRYVWITGAEPGATVQVLIGGAVIGHGDAPLGWAKFALNSKLRHLINVIHDLSTRSIGFKVLTGHGASIDTNTPAGGQIGVRHLRRAR